jgi:hypothetical protein
MDVFEPLAALLPLRDIATLDDLATELFAAWRAEALAKAGRRR